MSVYSRHSALSEGNSSLGNHSHNPFTPASLRRMSNTPHSQEEAIAQSNTANTRIVGGEILDSQGNSESTDLDSEFISESHPHTNPESSTDSKLSAVEYISTAIESMDAESVARSDSLSRKLSGVQKSEARRAVVPRLRFLARSGKSEALPLIAENKLCAVSLEKKKRSFILFGVKGSGEGINPFSFCDTKIDEVKEVRKVKARDSEKQSLESNQALESQKVKALDSKRLDLETKNQAESKMEGYSIKLDSSKSKSHTDSSSISESNLKVSKTLSESTPSVIASHSNAGAKQSTEKTNAMDSKLDSQNLDCHDFAFTKSRNDDKVEYSKALDSESKTQIESTMLADSKKLESKQTLESRSLQILKSPLDSKTPPLQSLPHKLKTASTRQDTQLQITGVALLLCGLLRDFGTGAITIGKHPKTSQIPQRQLGILRFLKKLRGACFAMINRGFQARSYPLCK